MGCSSGLGGGEAIDHPLHHLAGRDRNFLYERLPESSEALIYIAMIWVMLRRLA